MEKRSARFCRSIAPVRLYRDDLAQIVAYLQELSPETDLVLVTPRHEVSTVEGLAGLGVKEVQALEIRVRSLTRRLYDMIVSIEPESVFLCRTGDTPIHKRAFARIEALLLGRRRKWRRRNGLLAAAGLLGLLSTVVLLLAQSGFWPLTPYVGAVLAGISASLAVGYLATKHWSRSRIHLYERQERQVHWEYMGGALIILALIAVMALVAMGLAALI
jgi:hypothetical protein